MRAAVIADIHGNMPALEAVLSDIGRRNVDQTINLGDCVSGPLWPRAVCQLLMASDGLVIRGNHDRWVGSADPGRMGASDRYAFSHLDSVGCPAYNDPGDDPHVSECGSPHARYALLEIDKAHVSADLIAVSYDWKVAAAQAEKNGRSEWAHGLRTGWFKSILP